MQADKTTMDISGFKNIRNSLLQNKKTNAGLTLIIAILLTFLFTSITASITTFAFRELRLSGGAAQSLQAFYAADTSLECVLDADLNSNLFFREATSTTPDFVTINDCAGQDANMVYSNTEANCGSGSQWCFLTQAPLEFQYGNSNYQASISFVYLDTNQVILRSRGRYGTSNSRTVERGLEYRYQL